MPIYEYECNACGDKHEFIQKFSESPKRKCPSCGEPRLKRLISAAAFHLKGEGWYVTDFRDKDKKKKVNGEEKKAGEEAKESKSEEKSESKSDSATSGGSEAKPKSEKGKTSSTD